MRLEKARGRDGDNDWHANDRRDLRHDVGQDLLELWQHHLAHAYKRDVDVGAVVEHLHVALCERARPDVVSFFSAWRVAGIAGCGRCSKCSRSGKCGRCDRCGRCIGYSSKCGRLMKDMCDSCV